MPKAAVPVIERLSRRLVVTDAGCWIFTGALTHGYGVIGIGSRSEGTRQCHRVAYEYYVGEVPAGLVLDHLCRNRACCNPWHLEPVTRKINAHRGDRGPGYGPRERTHCKQGHEYTADNTYHRPDGSRRCRTCTTAWNKPKVSTPA